MNHPISKRAGLKESIIQITETMLDDNQGPFENGFRIIPYAVIPFLGSFGKIVTFILTKMTFSILGWSPRDLGRWLDKNLGLKPGDDPTKPGTKERAVDLVSGLFESESKSKASAYLDARPISKTAGLGSFLLASGKVGKHLINAVFMLFKMAMSVFVLSHIEKEFVNPLLVDPLRKSREEEEKHKQPGQSVEPTRTESVKPAKPKPKSVDEYADYLEQKYGLK